jgi:MFS family permease
LADATFEQPQWKVYDKTGDGGSSDGDISWIAHNGAPRGPGSTDHSPAASAWSPLRQPVFRSLWIAAVASNLGTWMHDIGAVWLMTSLAPSPIMVALMQTATSLPFFLLALPAGALADIVDRRRVLLLMQGWMLVAAALLSLLALMGAITPWLLLAFTFALGVGAAMTTQAWQVINDYQSGWMGTIAV